MKRLLLITLFVNGMFSTTVAQYAPQAGIAGSTAIPASSAQITGWASSCIVQRGYLDISQPSLGYTSAGDSSACIGPMDHMVVSLGDSGVATLQFANPIVDGAGPDFAVFENGFLNPDNNEEAFLELAFVEVSSDGANFFRFPSVSLTQSTSQLSSITGANYMNARQLNNLAGKYVSNYGTPFDLQELSGLPGLDINHVTHVRIVDVIGSINGYTSFDASGNKINDPYPTAFPTGGFDLDAVAAMHQVWTAPVTSLQKPFTAVYPNPSTDFVAVTAKEELTVLLTDISGKVLKQQNGNRTISISLSGLNSGIYFLKMINENGSSWVERICKL